ncbi:MAG: GNAT family N-acetyltransferase [Oscillospiraceae bacterium]
MYIRKLNTEEICEALPLVWRVFCEYEAVDYPASGKQAFWDAIHSEAYIQMLTAYGAYDGDGLLGIIATRNGGRHLALFFVEGRHHNEGIGRRLWEAVLSESTAEKITVHSSLYAVEIYKKLGFVPTAELQSEGGIQYLPMAYQR